MMEIHVSDDNGTAEFELAEGCAVCSGNLRIRLTPRGARSYCGRCHALAEPEVSIDNHEIRIAQPPTAQA